MLLGCSTTLSQTENEVQATGEVEQVFVDTLF